MHQYRIALLTLGYRHIHLNLIEPENFFSKAIFSFYILTRRTSMIQIAPHLYLHSIMLFFQSTSHCGRYETALISLYFITVLNFRTFFLTHVQQNIVLSNFRKKFKRKIFYKYTNIYECACTLLFPIALLMQG